MAETEQVFYLWGNKLDVTNIDGTPILRNGQIVTGELHERPNFLGVFLGNDTLYGGTMWPVTRVIGKDGIEAYMKQYEEERIAREKIFGPGGPPATYHGLHDWY